MECGGGDGDDSALGDDKISRMRKCNGKKSKHAVRSLRTEKTVFIV